MGKMLIVIGVVLIVVGLFLAYNVSIPLFGKLPGDLVFKGENYAIYLPITSCIVISIIISLIVYLFS